MRSLRIAMLLHKSVVFDSRVRREAAALAEAGHEVTVLELADVPADESTLDGFHRQSVLPPAWVRRIPFALYRVLFAFSFARAVVSVRPDVIHAHDAAMLLPGLVGRRLTGARLVYDSHELATSVPYRERHWGRFVRAIEQLAVPRAAAVITVSDGIAGRLQRLYGLRHRPVVLRNVCALPPPDPEIPYGSLRSQLSIPPDEPVVLHQGAAAASRGCENLVRGFAHVPRGQLVFLGDHDPGYRERLVAVAAEGGVSERVHFHPSVPGDVLLSYTRDADVGVSLLEDTCENHRLALPNKLFEYLAAGVPVVVSDLPEVSAMILGADVGWTADARDPVSIGAALAEALTHSHDRELLARVKASAEANGWEREKTRLLRLYAQICGDHRGCAAPES